MGLIKFTRNYNDLSTDRGFQFEFFCDRCGSGHQTEFQSSVTGMAAEALDAVNSLFGGMLGGAADIGRKVQSAAWEKSHDQAFAAAIEAAKPYFRQCKRCAHWVDDVCWDEKRGLCRDCAPDLESEYSAIQVQAAIEDAQEKARAVDYVQAQKFKQTVAGSCPKCGASVSGGKFCPECGEALAKSRFCQECGVEMAAGAKFCPECGAKQ